MAVDVQNLLKKAKQAHCSPERQHVKDVWFDLGKYVLNNHMTEFYDEGVPGEAHHKKTTSTTAIEANKELASILHSTVTSPAIKWGKFKFTKESDNNDKLKLKALEALVSRWYDEMYESNFDLEISRVYPYFCAVGNCALFVGDAAEEDEFGFRGFKFNAIHVGQLAWSEDSNNKIANIYRKLHFTAEQLVTDFFDIIPDHIKDQANNKPGTRYVAYEIIFKRNKKEIELNEIGLAPIDKRPFGYALILEKDEILLKEDGYYENPLPIGRWDVAPGELYGRSRAQEGLAKIKMLNFFEENYARSIDLAISPVFVTTRNNILGNFSIKPRAINVVRDPAALTRLELGVDRHVTDVDIPVLKEEVRKLFFLDKLLLPPRTETGEQTAFEIAERLDQSQRVLGPVIGRLNELLKDISSRSFNLMIRRMLEEEEDNPAKSLIRLLGTDRFDLKLEFVNPLARSQKISEVSNMRALMQDAMAIAQLNPEIIDKINFDFIIEQTATILGVSSDALKSDEEVAERREQRRQQQQKMLEEQMKMSQADRQSKEGS